MKNYINIILTVICFCLLVPNIIPRTVFSSILDAEKQDLKRDIFEEDLVALESTKDLILKLKGNTKTLMELLISQRISNEQRIRQESYSGLTEVRGFMTGTQPYHQSLHSGNRCPLSLHNHVGYFPLIGMGEFGAILNGIQFYTRHNDPDMLQPGLKTESYYAQRNIPPMPVPPSVLQAGAVGAQITEMIQYFKAWADQNYTHRDYRPYFRPMLGYVEVTFIHDTVSLSDPFSSDRHFIDAKTWAELATKIRYYLQSGRKNDLENLGYLPRILHDVVTPESYTVKVGSSPTFRATISDRGHLTPAESLSYLGQNSEDLDDTIAVYITRTTEGVFINSIFGNNKKKSDAGTASWSVICNPLNNTGCKEAKTRACFNNFTDCTNAVNSAGMGNVFLKWPDRSFGGVSYGPLGNTGCFSVSVYFTGVTGSIVKAQARVNGTHNHTTNDLNDIIVIEGCIEDAQPIVANLDYRVMYYPIDRDIPTSRLRVVDTTQQAMAGERNNFPETPISTTKTNEQLELSRNANYKLNSADSSEWVDSKGTYELLDELMETIPGRDGYGQVLNESFDGEVAYHFVRRNEVLNAAYYNRFYCISKDNNGIETKEPRRRGFHDNNLFVARTTRPEIVGLNLPDPVTGELQSYKYSFAVPIELVYRTPLVSWDPYSIGGDGRGDFHRVPYQFYEDFNSIYRDPSDTNGLAWGSDIILKNGAYVTGGGHYILFPKIPGINRELRQRWPLAPISADKNPGLAQARALKHMLNQKNAKELLKQPKQNIPTASVSVWTNNGTVSNRTHSHLLNINGALVDLLEKGESIIVPTEYSPENDHRHAFKISRTTVNGKFVYNIIDCDGVGTKCVHGHVSICPLDPMVTEKC